MGLASPIDCYSVAFACAEEENLEGQLPHIYIASSNSDNEGRVGEEVEVYLLEDCVCKKCACEIGYVVSYFSLALKFEGRECGVVLVGREVVGVFGEPREVMLQK